MQVLFFLSFRLGPVLALVIIATAAAAANYKKQTKLVEGTASKALSSMVGVADQAFRAITTVRYGDRSLQHDLGKVDGPGTTPCSMTLERWTATQMRTSVIPVQRLTVAHPPCTRMLVLHSSSLTIVK